MIINKITQTNFKGYENLISHTINQEDGGNFSFMAMKLNNNIENDLDTWHGIQKNLFRIQKPSDYIIFHSLYDGEESHYSALDRHLDLNHVTNKNDEMLMLKTFSLMASLTKRIINTEFPPENSSLHLTMVELIKNLKTILQNETIAGSLAMEAAMKKVKHYKTAGLVNNQITESMKRYFKL